MYWKRQAALMNSTDPRARIPKPAPGSPEEAILRDLGLLDSDPSMDSARASYDSLDSVPPGEFEILELDHDRSPSIQKNPINGSLLIRPPRHLQKKEVKAARDANRGRFSRRSAMRRGVREHASYKSKELVVLDKVNSVTVEYANAVREVFDEISEELRLQSASEKQENSKASQADQDEVDPDELPLPATSNLYFIDAWERLQPGLGERNPNTADLHGEHPDLADVTSGSCLAESDGLHLSARGNEVLFRELVDAMERHFVCGDSQNVRERARTLRLAGADGERERLFWGGVAGDAATGKSANGREETPERRERNRLEGVLQERVDGVKRNGGLEGMFVAPKELDCYGDPEYPRRETECGSSLPPVFPWFDDEVALRGYGQHILDRKAESAPSAKSSGKKSKKNKHDSGAGGNQ